MGLHFGLATLYRKQGKPAKAQQEMQEFQRLQNTIGPPRSEYSAAAAGRIDLNGSGNDPARFVFGVERSLTPAVCKAVVVVDRSEGHA